MRAKKGLIVQKIENDIFLIDSGEELPKFNGMIKLNETSNFIIDLLMKKDMSINEIYEAFLKEYEVSLEELKKVLPPIINELKKAHIIVE